MELTSEVAAQRDAVHNGRAYAGVDVRVFDVAGTGAKKWLNDLVTAGIHRVPPGVAIDSLLLDATGRIRAAFKVLPRDPDSFLLIQTADQEASIGTLLSRYVLSSDVRISDLTSSFVVVRTSLLRESEGPQGAAWSFFETWPSRLSGFDGWPDLADDMEAALGFEAERIIVGLPHFPVDFAPTSVPAEAGWDRPPMTDTEKGCFLGQETVAKIRNLGRPPFRIIGLRTDAHVAEGDPVMLGGAESGTVTSALSGPEGSHVIARVRYFPDELPDLRTPEGAFYRMSEGLTNVIK